MGDSLAYWGPEDLTEEQLLSKLEQPHHTVSCDVETVSVKDRWLLGIGVGLNCREAVYIRVYPDPSPYTPLVLNLLERAGSVIWHNGIFDLTVLMEWCIGASLDIPIAGSWDVTQGHPGKYQVPAAILDIANKSQDTSLMSQVQALPDLSLKDMCHTYAQTELDAISDVLPKGKNMLSIPWDVTANKCLHDTIGTMRLWHQMKGPEWNKGSTVTWHYEHNYTGLGFNPTEPDYYSVNTRQQECYDVDRRLIPLLLRMSARGIKLRNDRVKYWYTTLSERRLIFQDICTKEDFNPSSPQQVGFTLARRGNFLPFTKSKKQLKTDDEVLSELSDPLAAVVLEHRSLTKLIGTYFRRYLNVDRAYTHFRQDLSTSRLSSYDDNMQNLPDGSRGQVNVRDILEADSGTWSWMDKDQLETRILATASNEPILLAAYERGDDAHWITQQRFWPGTDRNDKTYRLRAKTGNHAMAYRAQDYTLAKHMGVSRSLAHDFREEWLVTYPRIDIWQLDTIEQGWEHGWVDNLFGRRCRLPTSDIAKPSHIEKCAVNYPIQSCAADLVKRVMLHPDVINMDQALQVHDEILVDGVVEFPEALAHLGPLYTPFKTNYGVTWV